MTVYDLCFTVGGDLELMGDEKETWKVKTLDEILQEKKRRRELEEKSDPKRSNNVIIHHIRHIQAAHKG